MKANIKTLLISAISLIFFTGCVASSRTNIKLEVPSKYSTKSWLYVVEKNKKDTGIIFLHGKRGDPSTSQNDNFISNMRDLGYEVIAPLMPWSEMRGYDGTRSQGMEVINAAVDAMKTEKVVVVGHSMGGMAVFQYGASGVSPKVVGLVSVAPGHDPSNADKLQIHTEWDAIKACKKHAAGEGKDRGDYPEMNGGKTYTISATAEYYCTHFSVKEYPDSLRIASGIKTPTFILSGSEDRLTWVYSHRDIYESLPKNTKNKHEVMSGRHLNVLFEHTDAISQWIDAL